MAADKLLLPTLPVALSCCLCCCLSLPLKAPPNCTAESRLSAATPGNSPPPATTLTPPSVAACVAVDGKCLWLSCCTLSARKSYTSIIICSCKDSASEQPAESESERERARCRAKKRQTTCRLCLALCRGSILMQFRFYTS